MRYRMLYQLSQEEIDRRRKEWEEESVKRLSLIQRAVAARSNQDMELFDKLVEELHDLRPSYCEHDHPMVENCIACDDIAKQVFPEKFKSCTTCQELFDPDELIEGDCDNCYYENHPKDD